MASDFPQREEPATSPSQDVPFAPTPVFARQGKSGRKPGARPRAAPEYETSSFAQSGDESETFILPEREVRPGRSIPMAALMAIPAAIVLAGGAYFLIQSREVEPETVAVATPAPGPLALTPPPAPVDATPLPPETTPTPRVEAPAARPQRQARASRARPAPPPAATDSGVEASTTTPTSPLSDPALTPEPAPQPGAVNPPVVVAPENPAPTAPSTPAPAGDTSVNPMPGPDSTATP